MFGEISMLYNTKRSANIRAKTATTCFVLDRKTFHAVTRQKIMRKRSTVMEIMTKIDIFRELEKEETFKIQDIIKEMPVHLNQYIIR
jgi:CRP-like cAMP-binding protein